MTLTETENREYKRQVTDELEKSVVSFLNTAGGELCIGIDDDGTVYGVENYDEAVRGVIDRIRYNVSPSSMGLFNVLPRKGENGKAYFVVKMAGGYEKPYYITKYGMSPKGCFYRVGTQATPMPQPMIDSLYSRRIPYTLRNVVSPNQHLTFTQLKIYYAGRGYDTDGDYFLKNLDLYTDDGRFNYLAYLMADDNGISIKMVQYEGTDKVNIVEKTECGYCSLVKATYSMLDALKIYNRTAVEITYPHRIETRLIEPVAMREAMLNAILHNDYVRGAYPVVEFYSDRVEITSTGGLPFGLSEEEFFKGVSIPRNREIMRIFSNLELCEQLGSGMHRIMRTYRPEDFCISEMFVIARFRYNEHALAVLNGQVGSERGSERGSEKRTGLSETKMRIITMISADDTITIETLAATIGVSTRSIEGHIKQLKGSGILEREGGDYGGRWKLMG
jgi:predicted HTH transcriptional regulator